LRTTEAFAYFSLCGIISEVDNKNKKNQKGVFSDISNQLWRFAPFFYFINKNKAL